MPLITSKEIKTIIDNQNIRWPAEQTEAICAYLNTLQSWRKKMNLVGKGSWKQIFENLILDSWHLAEFLKKTGMSQPLTLDIGAGAGLPGIPLRLFWSDGIYHLVESRLKRAVFMETALAAMQRNAPELPGITRGKITVHKVRIENLNPNLLPADLVISRAFQPWRDFLKTSENLVKTDGGFCIVMSSIDFTDTCPYNWELKNVHQYKIAGQTRYFWLFSSYIAPN